jgi:type II pantothenate kinase
MTLTKIVRATSKGLTVASCETGSAEAAALIAEAFADGARVGTTGARVTGLPSGANAVVAQEIDTAARGCIALLHAEERLGAGDFLMALMGTGTAFASVRGGRVNHMGGTAMGGGSFSGIARRVAAELSYPDVLAAAARGDRRNVDSMIADVYPEGIGRIGPDLTAAHLSKKNGSTDDFLAGLINLHGENIAQIACGRAAMVSAARIVLCGMFVHENPTLVKSLTDMTNRFGVAVETVPVPGYAGAIGAALIAAEDATASV